MDESSGMPWFPAWGIEFSKPIENPSSIVSVFNEWRPSDRWLLLSYHAACSEVRLWTVWSALRRREESDRMIARTPDAEFLRLVSGTRQLSIAFQRAGLSEGDGFAWIVFLPEFTLGEEFGETEVLRSTYSDNDLEATRLIEHLGAKLLPKRPIPTEEGLIRLGALEDGRTIEPQSRENAFLTHSALADM